MAYTSVEKMLYKWFDSRGLYPDKLGHRDVQDLAERVSEMIGPFRDFFRASQGWDGYDLNKTRIKADQTEKKL